MKKPWVDQDACISCGLCVTNVPEVFRFADNGKAEVYDPGGAYESKIVGRLITLSNIVASSYGDEKLNFQHNMEK